METLLFCKNDMLDNVDGDDRMLSKLSKLVLGLIWKRPLNPYEITKLLEQSVVQDWFPMTVQSIYTTIKNLSKNGYLTGEIIQEGNLPPKTIYELTEKGREALIDSLKIGLESYQVQASDFGISLFHICSIKKKDALELLEKRMEKINELKLKAEERLNCCIGKAPFNFITMLKYNVYRLSTELKITQELMEEMENDIHWDASFVNFLK